MAHRPIAIPRYLKGHRTHFIAIMGMGRLPMSAKNLVLAVLVGCFMEKG